MARLSRWLRFCVCLLSVPLALYSATVSGTVKDPSDSLIPGAVIQISGGQLAQPVVVTADAQGHFTTPDLPPGNYSLRATAPDFEVLSRTIDVADKPLTLDLQLTVANTRQEVTVAGKALSTPTPTPSIASCAPPLSASPFRSTNSIFKTTSGISSSTGAQSPSSLPSAAK